MANGGAPTTDDAFGVISHPLRRTILERLAGGETRVSDLAARLPVSRPAVSQHLRLMLDVGVVSERHDGRDRYYSLRRDGLEEIDLWLIRLDNFWAKSLERLGEHLEGAAVIDGDRVVHQAHYRQPVGTVWDALTDPLALAAWLMPNDFAPVVGHRFRLDSSPGMGIIEGEVLELEAPRFLRCRWTIEGVPSEVTITLHEDAGGTRLELEHVRLGDSIRPSFDGGWQEKLGRELNLVLTGEWNRTRSALDDGLYRYPHSETPI